MNIRKITENDIKDLAFIEQECFSSPWQESQLKMLLSAPFIAYTAEEDGKCIGYISSFISPFDTQILNIGVLKDYRKKGIATQLFDKVFSEIKEKGITEVSLEVRTKNENAISLYKKLGFEIKGVRNHFYKNPPDDAYVMVINKEV